MYISCKLLIMHLSSHFFITRCYTAFISYDPTGPKLDTCNETEGRDEMKGDPEGSLMYGLGGDDQRVPTDSDLYYS